ncbi:unnamed protein product, partial [marine sediment metagenome]
YDGDLPWNYSSHQFSTLLPKMPKLPQEALEMSTQQRREWLKEYNNTPERKAFLSLWKEARKNSKSYHFEIEPDGSFRVEDVISGTYEMRVELREPKGLLDRSQNYFGALYNYKFTVPQMPGDRSDEPLDTGDVVVHIFPSLEVGTPAPYFEAQTVDSTIITKTDYVGRVTLLFSWSTDLSKQEKQLKQLKNVYQAFSENENFAMIGLSWINNFSEYAKVFAEEQQFPWTNQKVISANVSQLMQKDCLNLLLAKTGHDACRHENNRANPSNH